MKGNLFEKGSPFRFVIIFLILFAVFYYFNIFYFGITSPGNNYSSFLARHLNYIGWLRNFLLKSTARVLTGMGYTSITNDFEILVAGHGVLKLVYSCLGLGIMSFFLAFVIAYPRSIRSKLIFGVCGIIVIQLLNIVRFVLLGLFWNKHGGNILDHHTIFNISIYLIIAVSLYFWVKHDDNNPSGLAKN